VEKTYIYAASTPPKHAGKTSSNHAPAVPHAAAASSTFFWQDRFRLLRLASTMANAHSVATLENSQPALWLMRRMDTGENPDRSGFYNAGLVHA
jgi:hypothetical protein